MSKCPPSLNTLVSIDRNVDIHNTLKSCQMERRIGRVININNVLSNLGQKKCWSIKDDILGYLRIQSFSSACIIPSS